MYVITGGAGFIGSNLVAALCDHGHSNKIVIVDNLGIDQKWRNIANHLVYGIISPTQLDAFLAEEAKRKGTLFSVDHLHSRVESRRLFSSIRSTSISVVDDTAPR